MPNADTSAAPTALVTGASSGVGYELAVRLLDEGWRVVALQRKPVPDNDSRVVAALAEARLVVHRADLAVPSELAAALATIGRAEPRIDWLVNNAGVSLEGPRPTASGRDVHFEVNVLAPYLVTRALLPNVAASAHRTIVQVSSNALLWASPLSREELLRPTRFKKLTGPYASSKLALSLWTRAFAARLPEGVSMLSVCPGGNDTQMTRSAGMPALLRLFVPLFFRHPKNGAAALLQASVLRPPSAPPFANGTFVNRGKATPLPQAERADELLSWVEEEAAS